MGSIMTDRCEPPPEWLDIKQEHWLRHPVEGWWSPRWVRDSWWDAGRQIRPEYLAAMKWEYVAPCRPDDATERANLDAEVARLRAALRVNALRLMPTLTHAEIDAEIERIAKGDA